MLRAPGRRTAQVAYGCRGLGGALYDRPVGTARARDASAYALWQGGGGLAGAALVGALPFTGDREFLRDRAWPVMKEAAEFYLDYMVEDPRTGKLCAGPAPSPENRYQRPTGRRRDSISRPP